MCDCHRCVGHALQLVDMSLTSRQPLKPGLHYVHVPGVTHPAAAKHDIERLAAKVIQQPAVALLARCCRLCVLHRNLLKAWMQAVEADRPAQPPAIAPHCSSLTRCRRRRHCWTLQIFFTITNLYLSQFTCR